MKKSKIFRKVISLLCVLAIAVSALLTAAVGSVATQIDEATGILSSLTVEDKQVYTFEVATYVAGAIAKANGKGIPGVVSGLNSSKIYNRDANNGTYAMKWASETNLEPGIMFGATGETVGNGATGGYVLESNKTYKVSYEYRNVNGTNLSLNLVGVPDTVSSSGYLCDSNTVATATGAWTTYETTFTTETVGTNKYLAFIVSRETTDAVEFWLDNVTITVITTLDDANYITFNDNGKVYYGDPTLLTELPVGNNGGLGTDFICWVDQDGNEVTEIPAAGTILNAKYPIITTLPNTVEITERTFELYGDVTSYTSGYLSNGNGKASSGVASTILPSGTSSSSAKIYWRASTRGTNSTGAIKWASSAAAVSGVIFGKTGAAGNGLDAAYELDSNTTYKVSYDYYNHSGANITLNLIGTTAYTDAVGTTYHTTSEATATKSWTTVTTEFKTGTIATAQYLGLVVSRETTTSFEFWIDNVVIEKVSAANPADYITFVDGEDVFYSSVGALTKLPVGQNGGDEDFLGWFDLDGNRVTEVPAEAGDVLTAKYGTIKTGIFASSIREESGSGDTYKSAAIRFRARIEKSIVDNATEAGFIIVPTGYAVDSNLALTAVFKNSEKNIIYEDTYPEYYDYQVLLFGLTKEGQEKSLCGLQLDVYLYYEVDGVTNYYGETYADSYNEVVARLEADLPVVNNLLSQITSAGTGEAQTDKVTGETLTLTPPAFTTAVGSASYADGADNTTLMTISNTSRGEYENYLTKLEEMGYTAIVGNSRVLSSSQNYSAIYSDGTNIINTAFIDFEKAVKVTIEPVGYDNLDDINEYFKVFHSASATKPETYVCDPLFLTIGTTGSENNGNDNYTKDMGYMYRLCDGRFVIIDGGSAGTAYQIADKIYSMLKYYAPDEENIKIAAWVMTHAHGDHMAVFKTFAPKYLEDTSYNVTLESIVVNLHNENWIANGGMTETSMSVYRELFAQCKERGTKVYKAHVGQVYNYPGFTNEILYTYEQTAPKIANKSMSNSTSIIFQIKVEGKSFLYDADATSTSINYVNAVYGKKMKSDFVQIPHHGTVDNFKSTSNAELQAANFAELEKFYTEYTKPTYTLWPTSEAGFGYYINLALSSNPNVVVKGMMSYDNMIVLGHNIKEMKLNAETIDYKILEYYEIGFLMQEPVAVGTEEEFKAIGQNPYGYYYLTNDITITETVTGPYWGSAFYGYLDGKGYTVNFANAVTAVGDAAQSGVLCDAVAGVIRNVNFGTEQSPIQINYSSTAAGAIGFFGSTKENITFDTVKVYANIAHTPNGSYGTYVGGFLGRIFRSGQTAAVVMFKNCEFIGSYTETATAGNLKAFGGFVGGMTGQGRFHVENCSVNATITGKNTHSSSGVGGIIGKITDVFVIDISGTTINGAVTAGTYVGGLVGNVSATDGIIKLNNNTISATITGTKNSNYCGQPGTITTIN